MCPEYASEFVEKVCGTDNYAKYSQSQIDSVCRQEEA